MNVEGGLVGPAFEKDQVVGVDDALKNFELFAAWFFHYVFAARFVEFAELGAFSRGGSDFYDESDSHWDSSLPLWTIN